MGSNSKAIVWFRRDLRIEDNPALASAAREGSVLPVYIWCPKEEGQFYPGRVSRWWLKQSLAHLDQSLRSLGAPLVLIKAENTLAALLRCIEAVGATKVVYNHLYDPVSLARDHSIKEKLTNFGISVQSFNGDLLYEPWEVNDDKGHPFTTFNAFWSRCLLEPTEPALLLPPWKLVSPAGFVQSSSVEELGLEDESEKSSNALLARAWSPGWSNADKALIEFVDHHLLDYSKSRAKVEGTSTSLLSPYLHFGEVSVRKVYQCIWMKQILWAKEGNSIGEESVNHFLRAIGLREYSRHICFNFPFTHEKSLLGNLRYFPWRLDQGEFKAWRQGRTGYPLVDAGMRELWATGWIHNRIRVTVASFFVKFLLLPWTWGMKYFWDTLLDADLESDILGWQYISGSLPDGHELDRMDSPEVQGFKFDPNGEYVRHWLPELARMPTEWIHHPWDAPATVLGAAGVELGLNYPKPIILIDLARQRLMDALSFMWEAEAVAKDKNSNGAMEVVVDNSVSSESLAIPRVVVREKTPYSTTSSHDQKVPSFKVSIKDSTDRKRSKYWEDDRPVQEHLPYHNHRYETSRRDEDDVCSTAESSSAKKRSTSGIQFSVPHSCSSSSQRDPLHWYEPPDLKQQQENFDMEQCSSKDVVLDG
ncbi:PREDICTED: cryptochrome-1-like isoform X2 [Nelumbo nucifera]|uniref:Photolyase/cryptochrome alpha/beta domain-containing protein n=2 Tax=Nelumbo nucifera TaxID=4432 RepID=A0A822Z5F5_NELNU|nr:PREDICTED: cryptochrome-1-like isoform X2 [Nelumbo nucifera]DAD36768.1 TPA_asm: hypothetical protein HUJ06_007409 [Nelumbo nucifera]